MFLPDGQGEGRPSPLLNSSKSALLEGASVTPRQLPDSLLDLIVEPPDCEQFHAESSVTHLVHHYDAECSLYRQGSRVSSR